MHHTRFHLNPEYLPGGRLSRTRVQDNNLHLLDYQQPIAVNDSEEFIEVTIAIRDYFTTIKPCHYSWPDFIKDIIPRYILLCKYLITFIIAINYFYCFCLFQIFLRHLHALSSSTLAGLYHATGHWRELSVGVCWRSRRCLPSAPPPPPGGEGCWTTSAGLTANPAGLPGCCSPMCGSTPLLKLSIHPCLGRSRWPLQVLPGVEVSFLVRILIVETSSTCDLLLCLALEASQLGSLPLLRTLTNLLRERCTG